MPRMTRKCSSVKAAIDVTTLITGDPQRDEHLRSPDFFDVANHPTMTFESRGISGSREHFKVSGDLTIRGQTREVTLDVTFNGVGTNPLGQSVAGFTVETEINRKDFGLNWNMALEAGRLPGWRSRQDRNRGGGRQAGAGARRRLKAITTWKSESIVSPPASTTPASAASPVDRMRELLERIEQADQVGLDVFGIGEHHKREFLDSAPPVILARPRRAPAAFV